MDSATSLPVAHTSSGDGLLDSAPPVAASLAADLASAIGGSTRAILHYGSRAQGRAARPDSPFDSFVIVDDYDSAYAGAAVDSGSRHRPRLARALARVLPPNAMALRRPTPKGDFEVKALIISGHDFERECSARARDHFVEARMIQTVRLVWSRDAGSAEATARAVRDARDRTFSWARGFLPPDFDLAAYCRTLIAVSFAYELRAEGTGQPEILYQAQRDLLESIYRPLLTDLAARGVLLSRHGMFRQTRRPGWWSQRRVRGYFRWSLVRTTLRLFKHPFLYHGWLEYLIRKVDRSTGRRMELTGLEQRHPLVFLWPRVIRYLMSRPR